MPNKKFILFDQEVDQPLDINGTGYFWSGYEEKQGYLSLLQYIEINDDHLRRKYSSFISHVGEVQFFGKSIIEHLRIKGFSYWWMSLLLEKSVWKSPAIYDALKLIALDEILKKVEPTVFMLVSNNAKLDRVFRQYCNESGIKYQWIRSRRSWLKTSYKERVPHILCGGFRLSLFLMAWIFALRFYRSKNTVNKPPIFVFSYLNNLDLTSLNSGIISTGYWGSLPVLFKSMGKTIRWVFHFVPNSKTPSKSSAI